MQNSSRQRNSRNTGQSLICSDHAGRAIGMIVLSGACFAMVGACIRLAGDIPLHEKMFFRSIVALVAIWLLLAREGVNPFARGSRTGLLVTRGVLGTVVMALYFYAIDNLTLADATILNKLSPFFVIVFAGLFLKEKLTRRVAIALVVAFAGAALVIKPQLDLKAVPAMAGLMSAVVSGATFTIMRSLKGKETPYRIVFFFSLITTLATLPPTLLVFQRPDTLQWMWLLGAGVFATVGQIAFTLGSQQAPVTELSVFNYAHVIFALIVGELLWGELPDVLSLTGSALIIGAAVLSRVGGRLKRAGGPQLDRPK